MKELTISAGGRKIKTLLNQKLVVITSETTDGTVPLFCPCCLFPMKTSEDSISYRKQKLCSPCFDKWGNKASISWPSGPNKAMSDWKEYIVLRSVMSRPTITFK